MSEENVFEKYRKLKEIIRSYANVAVAFSGGVDSSLLLYAAGDALNRGNVIALHGRSCLNEDDSKVDQYYNKYIRKYARLKVIDLKPLSWPNFVCNDEKRCYHCKKRTYSEFMVNMKEEGIKILLDGTNIDDLNDYRPGMLVIKELDVKTPLVQVGLNKKGIRFLARTFGLPNHSTPSNSCLATRLKYSPIITEKELKKVAEIELKFEKMGYKGCRVRPEKESVFVEIRQEDFVNFIQKHNRIRVEGICHNYGYNKVFLDITGRC